MAKTSKFAEARARYYIRDTAAKRGWNTSHVSSGGSFLEENEIVDRFPDIGLGLQKPDFLICIAGEPRVVVEARNESGKSEAAIEEAIGYADLINATKKYLVNVAIGASGTEEQGFIVVVRFRDESGAWVPLTSRGFELTSLPSRSEVELAYEAKDASTQVSLPSQTEFIEAAIEVSRILRTAKVEAPLRPKVIGALVLVMYESAASSGAASFGIAPTLPEVNKLVSEAIEDASGLAKARREDLVEALHLSTAAFQQLEPRLGRIIAVLRRLNVRAVMQTGVDFLGTFYEAFLRYGYDNNALGIVFTPRHITAFAVDLVGVSYTDRVIDIACGTGGFLVSAFDRMLDSAPSSAAAEKVKHSIYGYDTNPTVWALALLNMYFRGDGKSNIERASSLTADSRRAVEGKFSRAFLNPPFSQDDELERHFIDASLAALEPSGVIAVVVKSGVFADQEHAAWRREFLRHHSLRSVISLPDDLFYPTAAPTCLMIAEAHVPQADDGLVYLARMSNDGFEKLKGKRVPRAGSELPALADGYRAVAEGTVVNDEKAATVLGATIAGGAEWTPHEWLPQPHIHESVSEAELARTAGSILRTITFFPDLGDAIPVGFEHDPDLLALPYGTGQVLLSDLFHISNGRSSGEKNYIEGEVPYISSGDPNNSIVGLVAPVVDEVFEPGAITLTAFGQASFQPWAFMARGNGGSSVRVLTPKFRMSVRELLWFTSQINLQKWRFFYSRMAIKGRIERLSVEVPAAPIDDDGLSVSEAGKQFLKTFEERRALLTGGAN